MDKTLLAELTITDCTCRNCGTIYQGHGALCTSCHDILYPPTMPDTLAAHLARERMERKLKKRAEWKETV